MRCCLQLFTAQLVKKTTLCWQSCFAQLLLTIAELLLIMHALLHTGSGVYYGWGVGAVLPLLPLMAGLAGKKLACALLTSKHVVIGLFAMTCAVTWHLW